MYLARCDQGESLLAEMIRLSRKYLLFIDTTNDGTGAPDDSLSGWERDITFDPPHQPEWSVLGWILP